MSDKKMELNNHKLWYHIDRVMKWINNEYFPPIYVEINPTDFCNHNCWFCSTFDYLKKRKNTLSEKILFKIIDDLADAGIRSILFQGTGEPLMNHFVPDAIKHAEINGISTALVTNGELFDKKVIEKTLPYLSWCRISSIENNYELYRKTHGNTNKNQYEKVLDNINYAVACKHDNNYDCIIGVTFLPFKYNIKTIYDTAKMFRDIGVDYFQVKSFETWEENKHHKNNTHSLDENVCNNYKILFDKLKSLENHMFKINIRYDQFKLNDCGFKKDFNTCYGIEFETYIDSDGCVYPCHKFYGIKDFCIGDLNQHSFNDIWMDENKKNVFNKIFNDIDLDECIVKCKQSAINSDLYKLKNEPLCVNFI